METKEEFAKVRAEMKDGFDKLNRTLFGFGGSLLVTLVVFVFTH